MPRLRRPQYAALAVPAQLLLLLQVLQLLGLAAAQQQANVTVRCSVSIRQPTPISFASSINCRSQNDTSGFFVIVQNATTINHTVTYTLNGKVQTLRNTAGTTAANNYVQDSWLLQKYPIYYPAMIALGFLAEASNSSPPRQSQRGTTLIITASIVNVALPALPMMGSDGTTSTCAFSGLTFSGIENLVIQDSTFNHVRAPADADYLAAGAAYIDSNLDASDNFRLVPSISVSNSTFSTVGGHTALGAILLTRLWSNTYGVISIANSNFTLNSASGDGAGIHANLICLHNHTQCAAPSRLSVVSCRFVSNRSTQGRGAAMFVSGGSVEITGSTFHNNTAAISGGALYFTSAVEGEGGTDAQLTISGTTFSGNLAGTDCLPSQDPGCDPASDSISSGGGAVAVVSSRLMTLGNTTYDGADGTTRTVVQSEADIWVGSTVLVVRDSEFVDNRVAGAGAWQTMGAAVLVARAGPMTREVVKDTRSRQSSVRCTSLFQNVSFTNNTSAAVGDGGAIGDFASEGLTVDHCTLTQNQAHAGTNIVSMWSTSLVITGQTVIQDSGGSAVHTEDVTHVSITYSAFRHNFCDDFGGCGAAVGGGPATCVQNFA